MGEKVKPLSLVGKTIQELGREGQKHLDEVIQVAQLIMSSINGDDAFNDFMVFTDDEVCDPSFLCTDAPTDSHLANKSFSDGGGIFSKDEVLDDVLEEARCRYELAFSSLQAVLVASQKNEGLDVLNVDQSDEDEIERMKEHASTLRKELREKNKQQKLVIDQLRNLIDVLSLWMKYRLTRSDIQQDIQATF